MKSLWNTLGLTISIFYWKMVPWICLLDKMHTSWWQCHGYFSQPYLKTSTLLLISPLPPRTEPPEILTQNQKENVQKETELALTYAAIERQQMIFHSKSSHLIHLWPSEEITAVFNSHVFKYTHKWRVQCFRGNRWKPKPLTFRVLREQAFPSCCYSVQAISFWLKAIQWQKVITYVLVCFSSLPF